VCGADAVTLGGECVDVTNGFHRHTLCPGPSPYLFLCQIGRNRR
jgi:hypothetical protein